MRERPYTSIADELEMLAGLTGAAPAFVDQVRALFLSKAISLEEDVAPFQAALEDAFRREEALRSSAQRAHEGAARIRENLSRAGRLSCDSAERIREAKETLERNATRLRESGARLETASWVMSPGRRPVRDTDTVPVVPGPDDVQ